VTISQNLKLKNNARRPVSINFGEVKPPSESVGLPLGQPGTIKLKIKRQPDS